MSGWEAIRAEVMARIRSRVWPPGGLIPGEEVLAAEFGCARATVNRALTDLAAAGVLERKRKAGTRVAMLPVRRASFDIPVIRAEVAGRGQAYGVRVLHSGRAVPPVAVAATLGWTGGEMLHLVSLHLADGQPQVFEDRWLNPDVLPLVAPDFGLISANEWLVANVTFVSGDIAFSAAGATAAEAEALSVSVGAALFITERCTWARDAAITWVRLAHGPGYRLQTLL